MYRVLILSLLFFLFSTSGQATEKFRLYNSCNKIRLLVEDLSEDAKKINLTEEAIRNSVESRLRSARIYDENGLEYLYVQISVVGNGVSIETNFNKYVMSFGEFGMATTWDRGKTGTHGSSTTSKGFILSALSELIDKFIVEYLRANEKDCK